MNTYPVTAINPSTGKVQEISFNGEDTLWGIHRELNDQGFELLLFDMIVNFHGQYFADVYGEGIVSDRAVYDLPLQKFASDWLVNFCITHYK